MTTARLLERLVEQLTADGDLTPDWRETFLAVPRHVFIPDTVWRHDPTIDGPNDLVPVRRREQPDRWLEIAYANRSVTVQVDDGHPVGPDGHGRDISSSASHPGIVAQMLAASDEDDHGTLWLIDPGSGAWASLRHHPKSDGPYEVRQHGPRWLWDEVEAAYCWWKDAGDPKAADWRFTVTSDTQRVELNVR